MRRATTMKGTKARDSATTVRNDMTRGRQAAATPDETCTILRDSSPSIPHRRVAASAAVRMPTNTAAETTNAAASRTG